MTSYVTTQHDLTAYNITEIQGWIIDNYFQKIKVATNKLIFEWRALDHIPISNTNIKQSTDVSGTGCSPFSPFDWFHINSVDQNADGDYRHTSKCPATMDPSSSALVVSPPTSTRRPLPLRKFFHHHLALR